MSTPVLLLGLPETGKSTFLAALSWALGSGDFRLRRTLLARPRDYISGLENAWLEGRRIDRTLKGSSHRIELGFADGENEARLVLPDISGESLLSFWGDRRWTRQYDQDAQGAGGLLLFVRADQLHCPSLVEDFADATAEEEDDPTDEGAQGPEAPLEPFDASKVCPQTVLVDLLQSVARQRRYRPLPTTVVISAWDTQPVDREPSDWLKAEAPLLSQFLKWNGGRFPSRVFGVSAQGGDYDRDREALLRHADPKDRLVVASDESTGRDITLVLAELTA
mgnify:CR=1 FL=1